MKEPEHDLDSLWDWICSNIGFDRRGKEIIKAIKLYVKLREKRKNE